jgi:uncharacterized membrane protein YgcG
MDDEFKFPVNGMLKNTNRYSSILADFIYGDEDFFWDAFKILPLDRVTFLPGPIAIMEIVGNYETNTWTVLTRSQKGFMGLNKYDNYVNIGPALDWTNLDRRATYRSWAKTINGLNDIKQGNVSKNNNIDLTVPGNLAMYQAYVFRGKIMYDRTVVETSLQTGNSSSGSTGGSTSGSTGGSSGGSSGGGKGEITNPYLPPIDRPIDGPIDIEIAPR